MANTFIDRAAAEFDTTVETVRIGMVDGRVRYTIVFADRSSAELIVGPDIDWVELEQSLRTYLDSKMEAG